MTLSVKEKVVAWAGRAGSWLYAQAQSRSWKAWVALAAAVIVFVLAMSSLFGGSDHSENPATLVPRSVGAYIETVDLEQLFKSAGGWKLWAKERRATGSEQWNQTQIDLAGMIGDKVAGLGTQPPHRWLSGAKRAAMAFVDADGENAPESWALYLQVDNPGAVVSEINIEPGLVLERIEKGKDAEGVYRLTGTDGGELYFGVIASWLVVSSDGRLPTFAAVDSRKSSGFSLADADLLPEWKYNGAVRGVFNPSQAVGGAHSSAAFIGDWMAPEARVAFFSKWPSGGELSMTFSQRELSDSVRGGGLWFLFKFVFGLIGLACLILAIAIALVMLSLGGWLKALALRAGITLAPEPANVEPSTAFQEDAGLKTSAPAKAETEQNVATPVDAVAWEDGHSVAETENQSGSGIEATPDGDA